MTNLLLVFAVARASSTRAFAIVAIAMLVQATSLTVFRAGVGQVMLMKRDDPDTPGAALALAACVALLSVFIYIPLILLLGGRWLVPSFCALGVVSLFQDFLRYRAFSLGRPRLALLSDTVWLLGSVLVYVCASRGVLVGAPDAVAWFVISAACGAAAIARLAPVREVGWAATTRWLGRHRHEVSGFAAEVMWTGLWGNLLTAAVGIAGGLNDVAAFRAGQSLFAPLVSFFGAMGVVLIARFSAVPAAGLPREVLIGLGLLLGVALMYGLLMIALPESIGSDLLGASWGRGRTLLLPFAAQGVLASLGAVGAVALRARSRIAELLRVRFFTSPCETIAAGGALALTGSILAASWVLIVPGALAGAIYLSRVLAAPSARRDEV